MMMHRGSSALVLCAASLRVFGWPHFLLDNGCEKGMALVAGASLLPRIMNVIPTEDPTILEVYRACEGKGECVGALDDGDAVETGSKLLLVYAGTSLPDTQTTFVTSSGWLIGSEACGDSGGSLLCSSCGEGWLKRATWTPTIPGPAQVAVGFAHGNFGTPAVTVGILTLHIIASNSSSNADGAAIEPRSVVSDVVSAGNAAKTAVGDAECGVGCLIERLASAFLERCANLVHPARSYYVDVSPGAAET
jgi:hypothetical protein